MPTKDGFIPDDPLPLFFANEPEHPWDRAVISLRVLKASILLALATTIGFAILSVRNPVTLFADVTASVEDVTDSPVDKSALPPGGDQSTPTIQLTADAQPLLMPTAKDAPTRDEIVAAFKSSQSQAENSEHEALFRQFQAWAAEKDAQAQAGPIQPVEDSSAQVAENARASLRPTHRHVRRVRNERAEIRPVGKIRRKQNARVQVSPAQTAQAQDQSVQNAQAPSLLQIFGLRN